MASYLFEKSLRIIQITSILRSFWLAYFLSVIYQKFVGLNDFTIGISLLLMGVSIFVLDIPTGVFADKFGYKKSIIISYIFIALAFFSLVAAAFVGWWVALFVTPILFGFHYAFSSGAVQAYVYSIFKINKNNQGYLKFNSRLKLYTSVSTAIACIVGGVLYPFSQSLPYLLQGIIMVFATVMLLFLQPIKVKQEDKFSFLKQIKTATRVLSKKKIVFYLMISIFFINLSFNIFLHLTCQSFWLEKGITISEIGVIGAVIFIIDGLVSSFTSKIWSKFGEKNCYLLLAILSVVVQILLAFSNTLITITILSGLMFGIASIVGYIFDFSLQKRIKDATRATTSSISNMFLSLGYRVGLVGVGAMLALMTYSTSLILLASTFGIIGILLTLILLIKKNFK